MRDITYYTWIVRLVIAVLCFIAAAMFLLLGVCWESVVSDYPFLRDKNIAHMVLGYVLPLMLVATGVRYVRFFLQERK